MTEPENKPSLSREDLLRFDMLCMQFEEAWKTCQPPQLEELLAQEEEPLRSELLRLLLRVDFQYRLGNQPDAVLQEYLSRFPDQIDLVRSEWLQQRNPDLEETRPFHVQPTTGADSEGSDSSSAEIPGYEKLELIGKGGMGEVIRARQLGVDREVALKTIRSGAFAAPEEIDRFYLEINTLAALEHPNIIPVYEIGNHQGLPYFSMQLIQGSNLKEKMPEISQDRSEVAQLIAQVARTIEFVHQHGILHRDLKPQNILLKNGNEPVLIDFGLAKTIETTSELTRQNEIVGTVHYMSPEQARGERLLTVTTDVFSLGAILYECLTGAPPFVGIDLVETLLLVREAEPVSPRKINRAIPKELEIICLKCLRKERTERYQSALELAEDLENWLEGKPIGANPVPSWERFRRWCMRNPMITSLVATILLVIVLGAGVATWFGISEKQARKQQEWLQYVNAMSLAHREILDDNFPEAETLLDRCPDRLRNWEHQFLRRLWAVRKPQTFPRTKDMLWGMALSPDQKSLAAGSRNGTLHLWDVQTKKAKWPQKQCHNGAIWAVAFHPNGKVIASAGTDRDIHLWSADTGEQIASLPDAHPGEIWDVRFSPNGNFLASGCQKKSLIIHSYPLNKDESPQVLNHDLNIWNIAFHPGSDLLATASGPFQRGTIPQGPGELRIYKRIGPGNQWQEEERIQEAHQGPCSEVAFGPNGNLVATTGYDNKLIARDYPITSDAIRFELGGHASDRIIALALHPRVGHLFATGGWDQSVKIWDSRSRQLRRDLKHHGIVPRVAFHPRGDRLFSLTGKIGRFGEARVWNLAQGSQTSALKKHTGKVRAVAYLDDHQLLSAGEDGALYQWNTIQRKEAGRIVLESNAPLTTTAISRNGLYMATGDSKGAVKLWQRNEGGFQVVKVLTETGIPVQDLSFSPNGSRVAAAFANRFELQSGGQASVWEVPSGTEILNTHNRLPSAPPNSFHHGTFCATFLQSDDYLLTGSGLWHQGSRTYESGRLTLWNIEKQRPEQVLDEDHHSSRILCLALNSDQSLLATGDADHEIRLWPIQGLKLGPSADLPGHSGKIHSLAFHPKQPRLASASSDRQIKIWDLPHKKEVLSLTSPTGAFRSIAFSPNGNVLAAACSDYTIKLYETEGTAP